MTKEAIFNILYMLILVSITAYYYNKNKKRQKDRENQRNNSFNKDGEIVIEKLDPLGYFKYTDSYMITVLKEKMIEAYNSSGVLDTVIDERYLPCCYRLYSADSETLFEEGGFIEMLKKLQHSFLKFGLKFEIDNYIDLFSDEEGRDQSVIINGKKYLVFKGFIEGGWHEATKRLIEIINEELKNQNSQERLYTISGSNEAEVIFLTPDLLKYIQKLNLHSEYIPENYKESGVFS